MLAWQKCAGQGDDGEMYLEVSRWKLPVSQMSSDEFTLVGWVFVGDEILPSYAGIIYFINHYKDAY